MSKAEYTAVPVHLLRRGQEILHSDERSSTLSHVARGSNGMLWAEELSAQGILVFPWVDASNRVPPEANARGYIGLDRYRIAAWKNNLTKLRELADRV
ncbi:hypothetical protein MTO96_043900 [Rhipicephalus appendiculatus]